jgi:hypothetical protein
VATYMAKPILALWRLRFDETQGKVIYQYGETDDERLEMDYLEFIARLTAHIPEKGQVMVRYYGLYSNAHRGTQRKRPTVGPLMLIAQPPPDTTASPGWRELIRKVYEVDPLICPACGTEMKVIAFISNYQVIDRIIHHLGITFTTTRPPPQHQQQPLYRLSSQVHSRGRS